MEAKIKQKEKYCIKYDPRYRITLCLLVLLSLLLTSCAPPVKTVSKDIVRFEQQLFEIEITQYQKDCGVVTEIAALANCQKWAEEEVRQLALEQGLQQYMDSIREEELQQFKTTSLQLSQQSLEQLAKEGMSEEILNELAHIKNRVFEAKEELLDALKPQIGKSLSTEQQQLILKHAARLTPDKMRAYIVSFFDEATEASNAEWEDNGTVYRYLKYANSVKVVVSQNLKSALEKHVAIPPAEPLPLFIHIGFGDFGYTYQDAQIFLDTYDEEGEWQLPSRDELERMKQGEEFPGNAAYVRSRVLDDTPYWTRDLASNRKPYGYCFARNGLCSASEVYPSSEYPEKDALAILFVRKSR